jgi:TorA maturation chaperone TorD
MSELSEFLRLRADLYLLLGSFFYLEPEESYFEKVKKYIRVLEEIGNLHNKSSLKKGIRQFTAFYESERPGTSLLAGEFAHIFLSTGLSAGDKSVVPHESVYFSPNRLMMQSEWDQVYEIYCDNKAGKKKGFTEPEDHITAEMGFIAFMSEKASKLSEDSEEFVVNIDKQLNFMQNHLMRFAPKVCDDICKYGYPFYESMANIAKGFLEGDLDFLTLLADRAAATTR